jgi:DNA-binding beta-propeller fold protein YncE
MKSSFLRLVPSACLLALAASAIPASAQPYKVVKSARVGGDGGFDYVYADSAGRRLYIPRGTRVDVFDLDTLKAAGSIPNARGVHGVAVDPVSHRGFCSSNPVVMWDTQTLQTLKTIEVQGGPDGILFDPATERVLILSHRQPNATVIDGRDGSIVGTIDLGGAPEQGASDGKGRLYICLEDKGQVAVVDAKTLKVTAHYDLGGEDSGPAGMGFDVKNNRIFACCHSKECVVLDAGDGKVLARLPIGSGVDSGAFNPDTMEAFSSQGDGTLTVIKETDPARFEVEQNVATMTGAKTCTLDGKTGQVYLIAAERTPPPEGSPRGRGRGQMVPGSFTILVVGR